MFCSPVCTDITVPVEKGSARSAGRHPDIIGKHLPARNLSDHLRPGSLNLPANFPKLNEEGNMIKVVLIVLLSLATPTFGQESAASSAPGSVVHGRVERSPNPPPQRPRIQRYRGRETTLQTERGSDCACEPWRYAVVYLMADSLPPIVPPSEPPQMSQKDVMFEPSVMAVAVGTTVEFPNLDPFFHNVFSFSGPRKFDLGRYPTGESEAVTFDKPGLVKVFCEIHASMRAYVHVLETPYFAVANDKGEFAIPDVRPGTYTLHCWQENLSDVTRTVTVGGDSTEVVIR